MDLGSCMARSLEIRLGIDAPARHGTGMVERCSKGRWRMREVWQGVFWNQPTSSLSSPCCVQLPMENLINGPWASLVQEDPVSWLPDGIVGAVRNRVGAVCPVLLLPFPEFICFSAGFHPRSTGICLGIFHMHKADGVGWVNGKEFPWKMGMCHGLPACPCCATTHDLVLPSLVMDVLEKAAGSSHFLLDCVSQSGPNPAPGDVAIYPEGYSRNCGGSHICTGKIHPWASQIP